MNAREWWTKTYRKARLSKGGCYVGRYFVSHEGIRPKIEPFGNDPGRRARMLALAAERRRKGDYNGARAAIYLGG